MRRADLGDGGNDLRSHADPADSLVHRLLDVRFTMRTAVGTSLLGFVTHIAAGRGLDAGLTATMAAACIVSALLGAAAATHVPQRILARSFAVNGRRLPPRFGGPPGSG